MDRKIIISAVLLTMILFQACKQQSSGLKIGLMFPYTTGSRMAIEEATMKEKAKEYNAEIIVTDAKQDESLQLQQANELIQNGVNAIIIMSVNTNTAAEIVRNARNAGVKVIAYDRLISNCDLDFYITFNNYNVGKYMTDYALKSKPNGKYMVVGGDKGDNNAILVRNGQIETLKQAGKVEIISDQFIEDWSDENAYFFMKEYINMSGENIPDVILTSYDGLARGVRRALDECNITNNVLTTGQDAEPQSLNQIAHDKQTMTIYKPVKNLAANALDIAVKLTNGEVISGTTTVNNKRIDVPSLLLDVIVVDKSNIKETVIKDGMAKESEVF